MSTYTLLGPSTLDAMFSIFSLSNETLTADGIVFNAPLPLHYWVSKRF